MTVSSLNLTLFLVATFTFLSAIYFILFYKLSHSLTHSFFKVRIMPPDIEHSKSSSNPNWARLCYISAPTAFLHR